MGDSEAVVVPHTTSTVPVILFSESIELEVVR